MSGPKLLSVDLLTEMFELRERFQFFFCQPRRLVVGRLGNIV